MPVDVGARKQNVGLQISNQSQSMHGFAVQLLAASEGIGCNLPQILTNCIGPYSSADLMIDCLKDEAAYFFLRLCFPAKICRQVAAVK